MAYIHQIVANSLANAQQVSTVALLGVAADSEILSLMWKAFRMTNHVSIKHFGLPCNDDGNELTDIPFVFNDLRYILIAPWFQEFINGYVADHRLNVMNFETTLGGIAVHVVNDPSCIHKFMVSNLPAHKGIGSSVDGVMITKMGSFRS